jgi:hypothetical protein
MARQKIMIDTAFAIDKLNDGFSIEQIAKMIGIKPGILYKRLRELGTRRFSEVKVQDYIKNGVFVIDNIDGMLVNNGYILLSNSIEDAVLKNLGWTNISIEFDSPEDIEMLLALNDLPLFYINVLNGVVNCWKDYIKNNPQILLGKRKRHGQNN